MIKGKVDREYEVFGKCESRLGSIFLSTDNEYNITVRRKLSTILNY